MNDVAPPEAAPRRRQARFLYVAFTTLLLGQASLSWALFLQREKFLRALGPTGTHLILAAGLLPFLALVAILLWQRRHLPHVLGRVIRRLDRLPGIFILSLFFGAGGVFFIFFFWGLLGLFPSIPLLAGSLLATYGGCVLLLFALLPFSRIRELGQQLALMLCGVLAALLITEIGLRLLNPFPTYLILPPNARWEIYPDPEVVPGIEGYALYSTNEQGIRGDPYQADGRYNILVIGGSTTETGLLDDGETWTYLLQKQLNQEQVLGGGGSIWVGNVGRSGRGLVEHIHALQYFVPQFEMDAVILLVGINELSPILQQPDQYHAAYEDPENYAYYLHRSFYSRPLRDRRWQRSFPQNTAVWNLADFVLWRRLDGLSPRWTFDMRESQSIRAARERYAAAPLLPALPDLTLALRQYERNLHRILAAAEAQNVRLIFATQPAVWHENLSPEMARQLWFGFRGDASAPDGRYAPMALRAGLDRFNRLLLDFCREQQVGCIDLAATMDGQEAYFYDDVHFTEAGARAVADLLTAHIGRHGFERR